MKKVKKIGIAIAICYVFLLSGCEKKADTGETTQVFGQYAIGPSGILHRNSSYTSYMMFYDFASDEDVFLCSKTGCTHNNTECYAYLNALSAFYYKDSLYYFTNDEDGEINLIRANKYGENKEVITTGIQEYPDSQSFQIMEQDLYFIGMGYDMETERSYTALLRIDLETGEKDIDQIEDRKGERGNIEAYLITEKELLIERGAYDIDLNEYLDTDNGELRDVPWEDVTSIIEIYSVNLETGNNDLMLRKERKLFDSQTGQMDSGYFNLIQYEDHILLYSYENQIIELNTETQEQQILYTYSGEESMSSVNRTGNYYICEFEYGYKFLILKDWEAIQFLNCSEYDIGWLYGMDQENCYFYDSNSKLLMIPIQKFVNGEMEFTNLVR